MPVERTLEEAFVPRPRPVAESGGQLLWRPRFEFGEFLVACREKVGLSLRVAANELGISFTRLQKMERNGRYRVPTLELLGRMSALYGVPGPDLLREAGFEPVLPDSVQQTFDATLEFEALAFAPELNPRGMDREWKEAYAPRVQQQWVEFAYKLEALYAVEPEFLERLQSRDPLSGPPLDDPEAFRRWVLEGILRSGALMADERNEAFGVYLRQLRKAKGVTLQTAAAELGLSYATLNRLETGKRHLHTLEELRPLVVYYGVELEEALSRLGVGENARRVLFKQETTNFAFITLMEEPELRPMGMTPSWMEKISAAQKRHFTEFAERVVEHLDRGGAPLRSLVAAHRRLKELTERSRDARSPA